MSNLRRVICTLAAPVLLGAMAPAAATSQTGAQRAQTLIVNADQGRDTISRHIYGHFAEHLGRLIYDGIWTKEGAGEWRMRDDVVQALRAIKIPNLRWPGGCFADYYHWKDGIGPREKRPTVVNNNWGGVTEDNGVGTHEFLELDRRNSAPSRSSSGNVGSGTVQEMQEWWEYVNHPGAEPDGRSAAPQRPAGSLERALLGRWQRELGVRRQHATGVLRRRVQTLRELPARVRRGAPLPHRHRTE